MSTNGDDQAAARQRSGQTKRDRTRTALIASAKQVFSERGWLDSRLEDIARGAGSSVPTTYNHFRGGKQELIGVVYAPLLAPLLAAAQADISDEVEPAEAVARHVRRLTSLARENQRLTFTMLAAVHEQTIRTRQPREAADVRSLVPMPRPLMELVDYGQRRGVFRNQPPAGDVGAYHTNAILIRLISRPDESAEATASLVLSQLLPALAIQS